MPKPTGSGKAKGRTAKKGPAKPHPATGTDELMPLNKYLAHSGVCSRRQAAEEIKAGKVKVNNDKVEEPGYKVQPGDTVSFNGKVVKPVRQLVYILLNKPKDFITTSEDEKGRKTVLDLVKMATTERVYPVGRLDRNTTGVLLLTNDGDLAQQLTHPSYEVNKVYEVKLNKEIPKAELEKMAGGLQLEDGFIKPDAIGYAALPDKTVVGVEIHSGRNRIVRRMFESMGYDVVNLDRVMFAGLTKKNVPRGKWRLLNDREIRLLKHFNKPAAKKHQVAAPSKSQRRTT